MEKEAIDGYPTIKIDGDVYNGPRTLQSLVSKING